MVRHSNIFIVIVLFICLFIEGNLKAQDASFSQNYASPLYLSPSFTGLTDGSRLSLHYRDQWPSIPGTYKTLSCAFDHYIADYNSGVGLQFYRDDQGKGMLINQNVGLLYAYEIYVSDKVMVRPGLQFKLAQSFIDPSKAVSGREIGPGGTGVTSTPITVEQDQFSKFDAAASVMIYSNLYWGGITVDHLVKSDVGFTDIESNYDLKMTMFGGYKWVYKEGRRRMPDQSVTFAFNYRKQADFSQLDLGAYWVYNPIELGLWYRGLPGANQESLRNQDAIIAIMGIHLGQMRLGYSFDLTLSELAGNTGGSHEFSIMYTIPSSNKPKINRSAIPCSQPGYSGGGASRSKYRSRSRRIF
ncbi:PorP/SprF family type IX secretion system membrane protein [Labilibacter marinus]|uniref:PorP/SprF family type IX secretion system membrane protein n=1 Tax=Labilibacter marinus TaxID=1477105 RepID=UPI0008348FDC|nr:PorP/SprF family type IX secretion system membrane protein [Labilibacter marinus]